MNLRAIALCAVLGPLGCVVTYDDDAPPGLDEVPALDVGGDDELVFERELRWWTGPRVQRVELILRADGSYVLLRRRWQGPQIYGWAEGTLTVAGGQRLADALAVVDPSQTEPVPGDYDCTYVEALPSVIHVDGEVIEYLGQCPPQGAVELAGLYEDLVELLLDCPLDPSWYEGELPIVQDDCAG